MKRLLGILALSCAWVTAANADTLSLYRETQGICDATVPLPAPNFNSVYVIHKNNDGARGSQFSITNNSGLIFVSFTSPYQHIGVWDSDLALNYGNCLTGDQVIGTVNLLWFGNPVDGCAHTLDVAPGEFSTIPGEIVVADCEFNVEIAFGGRFYFTATPDLCTLACAVVPVRESTWGAVKALYR